MSLLTVEDVHKTYSSGEAPVHALRGVSLEVDTGEFVALVGPSGCGKSSLLHLCGGMDRPTSGSVVFDGQRLESMPDDELTRLRRERIGFVFQFFNLLPTLTLGENIGLPLSLAGVRAGEVERTARALADRVGLAHRFSHYPQQVSGGEMQRAAIARAIVHDPALIIADEPTGNLDSENGDRVIALLRELNQERGITLLLATHAAELASAAERVVTMRDGCIVRDQAQAVRQNRAAL